MAGESKTRIVAMVEGVPRRLLSVDEQKDGKLIISLSVAPIAFDHGQKQETSGKVSGQKYTVHLSEKTRGNSIHHTLVRKDQPRLETYLDTLAIADGLVQPLYTHMHRNLRYPSAIIKEKTKERLIVVADYDPRMNQLHTMTVLAPPGAHHFMIDESPLFGKSLIQFQRFSLFVLTAYSYFPSHDEGRIAHLASKQAVIGDMGRGDKSPPMPGVNGIDARSGAEELLLRSHELAFEIYASKLLKQIPPTLSLIEELGMRLSMGIAPNPTQDGDLERLPYAGP